jgi:hypothetical protein
MRPIAIALSLLGLLLAGCGGEDRLSKEEYTKELRGAGQQLQGSFTQLGTQLGGQAKPAEVAQGFTKATGALRSGADRLDRVEPPEAVEPEHDRLVAGLREFANDFSQGGEAAKRNDTRALSQFGARLATLPSAKKLQEAGEALRKKGYNLQSG